MRHTFRFVKISAALFGAALSIPWTSAQECVSGYWSITLEHACQNVDCTATSAESVATSDVSTTHYQLENGGTRSDYSNAYDGILKKYVVTVTDVCRYPVVNNGYLSCQRGISDVAWKIDDLKNTTSDIYLMQRDRSGNWSVAARYYGGSDLLNNEVGTLSVPNKCADSTCVATSPVNMAWNSTSPLSVMGGVKSAVTSADLNRPRFVDYPALNLENQLANEPVVFDAKIEDPHAAGCTNVLDYVISVVPMTGWSPLFSFSENTKNAAIAGSKFFLSETWSELSVLRVRETLNVPKTGLWKVRVEFRDASTNSLVKNSDQTLEIIPNYPSASPTSKLIPHNDYSTQYYIGDNLLYDVQLNDASGNRISWVLPTVDLAHQTQNSDVTWLGTATPPANRFSADGSWNFWVNLRFNKQAIFYEKFRATYQKWDRFGSPTGVYGSLDFDTGKQFFIKDPTAPSGGDFLIPCTKGNVTLTALCVVDDLSWCGRSESVTFTNESQNGSQGVLKSWDVAGNVKQFVYSMNHIDRTSPVIASSSFNGSSAFPTGMKAKSGSNIIVRITDTHPAGCSAPLSVSAWSLTYPRTSGTVTESLVWSLNGTSSATLSVVKDFTKIWPASLSNVVFRDKAGNTVTFPGKSWTIYPDEPSRLASTVTLASGARKSEYPGGLYYYLIKLKDQFGNPIYSKPITSVGPSEGAGDSVIKTDMSDPSNPKGDAAESVTLASMATSSTWTAIARLSSLAPGIFSETFAFTMDDWDEDYRPVSSKLNFTIGNSSAKNAFMFPHSWSFAMANWSKLALGTSVTAKLTVTKNASATAVPNAYELDQFNSNLKSLVADQTVLDAGEAAPLTWNPEIDFRVDATRDSALGTAPKIHIENGPVMNYAISGKNVRYLLRTTYDPETGTEFSIGDTGGISGIRIVWTSQSKGKAAAVGQAENFSAMTAAKSRDAIRKAAEKITVGMKNGDVLNGVKYYEGQDVTVPASPDFETLVIKWGNAVINSDVNVSGKKFGIIVLRSDWTKISQGNVYVSPNVRYVRSMIYADGGFVSSWFKAGEDRVENYKDSSARTSALNKQLVIKWGLFTANTIGGAVLGSSGKYVLPSGKTTNDFGTALAYDLNFFRRSKTGFDKTYALWGTSDINGWYSEPTIVFSDANLSTNPPKGFK